MAYKSIRDARKKLNLTQDDLAAKLGVNRATISKYENGVIDIPPSQARELARILKIGNWYELYPEEKQGDAIVVDVIDRAGLTITDSSAKAEDLSHDIKQDMMDEAMTYEEFQDAKNTDVHDIQLHLLENDVHRRLMQKIDDSMRVLNDDGKQEAVKRVEELTEIPKYQLHHDPDEK